MCRTGLIEPWFGTGLALGRVLDQFETGVAGVELDELGAGAVDADAGRERLAADRELAQYVQSERVPVEGDGAVEVADGDGEVVCGGLHIYSVTTRNESASLSGRRINFEPLEMILYGAKRQCLHMDRRAYLATTAAVIGVGTAGCQTQQDGTQAASDGSGPNREGDIGQTATTADGIQVTYEDLIATQTVVTSESATAAMDGRRLVLLKLAVRNNTGGTTDLPDGERFELAAGENTYRRTTVTEGGGFGSEPDRIQQPVLGDEYRASGFVDPGDVASGWLVASVPTDRSEFTLRLTGVTTESGDVPTWSVIADTGDVATCAVTVDGPQTVTQATEASYTITAENTGNRPVRCYRQITATRRDQAQTTTVARSLDAGETHQTPLSITPRGIGTFTVDSSVETYIETSIEIPTFRFGESWSSPNGLQVTVSDLQFAQEATYEPDYYNGKRTAEAGTDSKFAFFTIEMSNVGTTRNLDFPGWRNVRIEKTDGNVLSRMYRLDTDPERWVSPVSGTPLPESTARYDPGESRSAWVLAEIPSSVGPGDMSLRVTTPGIASDPEYGAKWTGG